MRTAAQPRLEGAIWCVCLRCSWCRCSACQLSRPLASFRLSRKRLSRARSSSASRPRTQRSAVAARGTAESAGAQAAGQCAVTARSVRRVGVSETTPAKRRSTRRRFCWLAISRSRGYHRRDGTYVQPHIRSAPDSSYNNWSTHPNVNPYTGQQGTRQPRLYDSNPGAGVGGYGSGVGTQPRSRSRW
jgi:hypothetical protein